MRPEKDEAKVEAETRKNEVEAEATMSNLSCNI